MALTEEQKRRNREWVAGLVKQLSDRAAEINRVGWVTLPDGRCYPADRVPQQAPGSADREPGEDDA